MHPAKRKYFSSFQDVWMKDEIFKEWLKRGSDDYTGKCELCSTIFTVKHDGLKAVNAHFNSIKHKSNAATKSKHLSMSRFISKQFTTENDKITASELTLTYHGVKHHHSYISQDCGNKLIANIFGDSPVASKISCARTKAEALVTGVLFPFSQEKLLNSMKNKPFSIGSDASNKGNQKYFPLVVTHFSVKDGIRNDVLDFYQDADETSEGISSKIKSLLAGNELKLADVVSYSADNASVNYGKHKSVYTKLKNDNPKLIKANCNCHILHNCAKFGFKIMKYDVETLVLKIYSDFSSSSKHIEELKSFCEFSQQDYCEILRHIGVRWLTLQTAVERLVKMWRTLKMYYIAQGEENAHPLIWKFVSTQQDEIDEFSLSMEECFLHFVNATLPLFTKAIKLLESDGTLPTDVHKIMTDLKNQIVNRKNDKFYGFEVNMSIENLSDSEKSILEDECLNVYDRLLQYLEKWYDDDSIYGKLSKFDLYQPALFSFNDICYLAKDFDINIDGNELYNEYCVLKAVLPTLIENQKTKNCCELWMNFFQKVAAPNLLKIMEYTLSIPVSNAHVERVFSVMKSLWTDSRNKLSTELVKAEIAIKMNLKLTCQEMFQTALQNKLLLDAARGSKKYKFSKE